MDMTASVMNTRKSNAPPHSSQNKLYRYANNSNMM